MVMALAFLPTATNGLAQEPMEYPETTRGEEGDEFFGVIVKDPYRG